MDPVQKAWMFENWVADQTEQAELAKNHAYLLASFSHPEEVKRLVDGNAHQSTEEDFEESLEIVKRARKPEETPRRKRRRKG